MISDEFTHRMHYSLGDNVMFIANPTIYMPGDIQVIVQYDQGEWNYILNSAKQMKRYRVPNMNELSEEEFFQQSLIWDYPINIDLLRVIQCYGTELVGNYEDGTFEWVQQYEY